MIWTFHSPLGARCPFNTGSVRVMQTAFSLHIVIFFLSEMDIILLSASTDNDNKFCATGILCAIFALAGRSGRRSSPLELACISFLVAEMILGLLGVITLLFNITSFLTMLMVAPESAQALSSLLLLKQANWFAVATGMYGVVNVAILLVGGDN